MGVIKRQGIKQSIVNYIGVTIGALSTLLIYPLDTEAYGLARFLIDTAVFLAPFLMLGFAGVSFQFFPYFRDKEQKHWGFLPFLLLATLGGVLLFLLLAWLFKEHIYTIYSEKSPLFSRYLIYTVPIAILVAFIGIFNSYSTNLKRIVVPGMLGNLIKIVLPLLMLGYIWKYLSRDDFVNGILINYVILFIATVLYIHWLGHLFLRPNFKKLNRPMLRQIGNYALFSLFGSIGSVLAFRIDSIMVATLVDLQNNGVYGIAAFIATAIAIPTNAIVQISSPIISDSLKKKDLQHVEMLYKRSSINLIIAGCLLLVGIIVSLQDLFALMPNADQLQDGIWVVILIGLAKLIDMATSVNNQIINYSQYYRFSFYAILCLAVFNVVCNLLFIPRYQIVGAAMATLASLSLYNGIKLVYIYKKFRMHPFSRQTVLILGIAVLSWLVAWLIPLTHSPLLNILIRSAVITCLYIPLVYRLKVSEDVNQLIDQLLSSLQRYTRW